VNSQQQNSISCTLPPIGLDPTALYSFSELFFKNQLFRISSKPMKSSSTTNCFFISKFLGTAHPSNLKLLRFYRVYRHQKFRIHTNISIIYIQLSKRKALLSSSPQLKNGIVSHEDKFVVWAKIVSFFRSVIFSFYIFCHFYVSFGRKSVFVHCL